MASQKHPAGFPAAVQLVIQQIAAVPAKSEQQHMVENLFKAVNEFCKNNDLRGLEIFHTQALNAANHTNLPIPQGNSMMSRSQVQPQPSHKNNNGNGNDDSAEITKANNDASRSTGDVARDDAADASMSEGSNSSDEPRSPPAILKPVEVGISPEMGCGQLISTRDAFVADLKIANDDIIAKNKVIRAKNKLIIANNNVIKADNKANGTGKKVARRVKALIKKKMTFTAGNTRTIANLFFADLIGIDLPERVNALIRKCSQPETDGIGTDEINRALAASQNIEAPEDVRTFFSQFAQAGISQPRKMGPMEIWNMVKARLDLFDMYQALKARASRQDADLMRFLDKNGFQKSKGRGSASLVADYLVRTIAGDLAMDRSITGDRDRDQKDREEEEKAKAKARTKLYNDIQEASVSKGLVETFGTGILVTFHKNTMSQLTRIGQERINIVCELVMKHVPQLVSLCKLLGEHVYEPFAAGQHIRCSEVMIIEGEDLTSFFTRAIGYGDDDEDDDEEVD